MSKGGLPFGLGGINVGAIAGMAGNIERKFLDLENTVKAQGVKQDQLISEIRALHETMQRIETWLRQLSSPQNRAA